MIETTEAVPRPKRRRPWGIYAAYVAAVLAGVLVAALFLRPHQYAGTIIQSPYRAPALDGMYLHTGDPAELWRYDGEVVVVYFGYTHCPDVCPTTLSAVARAKEQLATDDADRVETLMVTVDPERDTPEVLGDYMTHFDPAFLGVWGDQNATRSATTLYGVTVVKNEGTSQAGYTVDHTTRLIGIDTDGFVRIIWPTDVTPDALAADLEELLG